jgi:acyl-CoA thioester hydrolase
VSNRIEEETRLLEQVLKLPRIAELDIPEDYLDSNRQVNMMYYTLIGNLGWRAFFEPLGMDREHFKDGKRSTFALKQIISYLNELKEDDHVAVHGGLLDFDSKRIHFMYYIVNLTSHKIACSDERLIMYIDMTNRRSATFESQIVAKLEKALAEHASLGWKPELSGAIQLKK